MLGKKMRAGGAAGVLEAVAAQGGSPAGVLAAVGLTSVDLADPDRLLEVEQVMMLFEAAARATGDDRFGLHLGTTYAFASIGPLAYAVLNAPTVAVAVAESRALRPDVPRGRRHHARTPWRAGRARLRARRRRPRALPPARGRRGGRERPGAAPAHRPGLAAARRLFGHSAPRDTTEHARLLGAPLRFRQPIAMTIVFDADVLARPVPGADRRLLPIVERHLEELLASKDGSVLDDVRNAIAETLCDGAPTIRVVAKRLGASVRTLQRRLAAHGAVFTTLVEDVRRDVALRYLADGKAAVTEIAFLTGYSEASAFGRAFRRWTGSTPPGGAEALDVERALVSQGRSDPHEAATSRSSFP